MNILIIANIEWKFLKQRHQFLAETLSRFGHNVVFVESSAKRNPTFKDIPRIFARVLKAVAPSEPKGLSTVKVISPLVLPSTFKLFRRVNEMIFIPVLERKIRKVLNGQAPDLIINYLPSATALSLWRRLDKRTMIYDCVSNFEGVSGMPSDVAITESELIAVSKAVVADCEFLYQKHKNAARVIRLVEPGVDYSHFGSKPLRIPESIRNVLYYGLVNQKLDLEFVKGLIDRGLKVTMLGPVAQDVDLPNGVCYMPPVAHGVLPEIVQNYDALLLPYADTPLTQGIIPAKFFEYFALGLPIIATDRANWRRYSNVMVCSDSADEIMSLLNNYSPDFERARAKERKEIAQQHGWDAKAKQFLELGNA